MTSSISYGGERASGGPVTPDRAYLVNERGTEILMGASGTVLSNSQSRKMLEGASGNHYYSIDARGTDPVLTEQRSRVAIMAAHNSAVGTGFRVQQEHLKHAAEIRVGSDRMTAPQQFARKKYSLFVAMNGCQYGRALRVVSLPARTGTSAGRPYTLVVDKRCAVFGG